MNGTTKWIVPIMGFRERTLHETGIERAWKALRPLTSHDVFLVTPYEWDEDVTGLANFIRRNSDTLPEVMVIAYSWGCGQGFIDFAREAACLNLQISIAVLCDPVYRSRFLPTWIPANPMSVLPICRPTITVPCSVRRVAWVRQCVDIPSGHDLVAEDPQLTRIGLGKYLKVGHTRIDDSPEFQELAEMEATAFVHGLEGRP